MPGFMQSAGQKKPPQKAGAIWQKDVFIDTAPKRKTKQAVFQKTARPYMMGLNGAFRAFRL